MIMLDEERKSIHLFIIQRVWWETRGSNSVSWSIQVIYKKTQVPCPLPYYQNAHNLSLNGSEAVGMYQIPTNFSPLADVSPAGAAAAVHLEPHGADAEDMCTPKYFVFNSQVRCFSGRPVHQSPGETLHLCLYGTHASSPLDASRRPTPSPSWPSPSSATRRCCPSTASSRSECCTRSPRRQEVGTSLAALGVSTLQTVIYYSNKMMISGWHAAIHCTHSIITITNLKCNHHFIVIISLTEIQSFSLQENKQQKPQKYIFSSLSSFLLFQIPSSVSTTLIQVETKTSFIPTAAVTQAFLFSLAIALGL